MVKQILKYNLTKIHHTWDRNCLGLTLANKRLTPLILNKTQQRKNEYLHRARE